MADSTSGDCPINDHEWDSLWLAFVPLKMSSARSPPRPLHAAIFLLIDTEVLFDGGDAAQPVVNLLLEASDILPDKVQSY
jgi:hypothetical protein